MESTEQNHSSGSRLRKLFRKSTKPDPREPVPIKPWAVLRAPFKRAVFDPTEEWARDIQSIERGYNKSWRRFTSNNSPGCRLAKRAALLSCAHLLERNDVRTLLLSVLDAEYSNTSVVAFLDLLPLVQTANPTAVDDFEVLWSASLKDLVLSTPEERTRRLFFLDQFLHTTLLDPLLEPLCTAMIQRSSTLLLVELNSSRANLKWINWANRSKDLSDLANSTMSVTFADLYADWKSWACWHPNQARLHTWTSLSGEDAIEFKDLLELEGPDFESKSRDTLRNSLASVGSARIEALIAGHHACDNIRVEEMLEKLLSVLDQVVFMAPKALASFREVYNRRPIDLESLEGLAAAAGTQNVDIFCAFSQIVVAQTSGIQLTGTIQAVPLLSKASGPVLREKMAPKLVQIIENNLAHLQARICENIKYKRQPNAVVNRISDLATSLSGADWLSAKLTPEARLNIKQIPERATIDTLFKLYERYSGLTTSSPSPLVGLLNEFVLARFGGRSGSPSDDRVIESLVSIWNAPVNRERRELSYAVATAVSMPMTLRAECLQQIMDTPEQLLTDELMVKLHATIGIASERNCLRLARLIITERIPLDSSYRCWHRVLHWMLEEQGNNLGSKFFSVDEWFVLVNDLGRIANMWEGQLPCNQILLQSWMSSWARELEAQHLPALRRLQKRMISNTGLQWVLRASRQRSIVSPCLEILDPSKTRTLDPVVESMLGTLDPNGSNIASFCKTLALLKAMSEEGSRLCLRMCQMCKNSEAGTAEYFVKSWQERSGLSAADKLAVRACARALGLQLDLDSSTVLFHQDAAKALLISDFKAIRAEIELIDSLRRVLQLHDAAKTSALIQRMGVNFSDWPQGSGDIPPALVNVVEKIGEDEFELFYPLTHLKPLQRIAMAIGNAQGLVVRVLLRPANGESAFCMHLHPDNNPGGERHTKRQSHQYWKVARYSSDENSPDAPICYGRPERANYQLSRTLHRYLATEGRTCTIEGLYNFILTKIGDLANCCVVCGRPCAALWRSTTCQVSCSLLWRRSSLQVRLLDLQADPLVVDILLTMIYGAARSGMATLLRGCPVRTTSVVQTIDTIPALSTLQSAPNIAVSVKNLGTSVEKILSWATHSYRGFLTSATGNLKIPNMPGVTQFVLANPNPEHHSAFSQSGSSGRVVFHGTSLDRLYPIVCESLKSLSGTALQRFGAAFGYGIYLAYEPSTSMFYANKFKNNWAGSSFSNLRVLLGCELVGPQSQQRRSVYVIKDENLVAVRYIFIFADNAAIPDRRSIEAPMESAYAAIRSGIA